MTTAASRDVWITGVGLVSSLGEGAEQHWERLSDPAGVRPVIDATLLAPFPIHPLAPLQLNRQIPAKSDQRQMEPWQQTGTYAAGLALASAGVAGNADLLGSTHMIVAAGAGERDIAVDNALMTELARRSDLPEGFLNSRLSGDLRPTLFLAQLSNLLAGNISIVHGVTGSSRTFLGEEPAGVSAVQIAARRIEAGQGDLFLVGGASNAARKDVAAFFSLGGALWRGPYKSVWARHPGGGTILGSLGAFLVLEARQHAERRSVAPLAQLAAIGSARSGRSSGAAAAATGRLWDAMRPDVTGPSLGVISGASGHEPATAKERAFLQHLAADGSDLAVRAVGSVLGHALDAHFPACVAVACLALARGAYYPPFDQTGFETDCAAAPGEILVTSFAMWRGAALALLTKVD